MRVIQYYYWSLCLPVVVLALTSVFAPERIQTIAVGAAIFGFFPYVGLILWLKAKAQVLPLRAFEKKLRLSPFIMAGFAIAEAAFLLMPTIFDASADAWYVSVYRYLEAVAGFGFILGTYSILMGYGFVLSVFGLKKILQYFGCFAKELEA